MRNTQKPLYYEIYSIEQQQNQQKDERRRQKKKTIWNKMK